jgi:SAM-dependent methyltransferase
VSTRSALETQLAVVAGFDDPSAALEQYPTPPGLAASVVHDADLRGDVEGTTVVDLGTGTGMLALGAALRAPTRVVGVELDPAALATARDNRRRVGVDAAVGWVRADVTRLLFPLAHGYDFAKGYYARVENDRLYGRLFRLFFVPLVRALSEERDASILRYLDAFRYALAGEFAATTDLVERFRPQRSWGLEVGTLGDAFDHAGFGGSAQVDLGTYEHDHRAVSGPTGLSDMSRHVGAALLRVVEDGAVDPEYGSLPERYRAAARSLVRSYELDAAFNGLTYDRGDELDQIETYADAIEPPGTDRRLPAWTETPVSPERIAEAAAADLEAIR